jgi:hypothetical protein
MQYQLDMRETAPKMALGHHPVITVIDFGSTAADERTDTYFVSGCT